MSLLGQASRHTTGFQVSGGHHRGRHPQATAADSAMRRTLPSVDAIARAANRRRHRFRPRHPADLEFELSLEHMPDNFLRGDVRVGSRRHIIIATDRQLELLSRAKTWYIDGTFKVRG